ncbi:MULTISPECIES: sugar ABC transporter substrate-binding protein [Microbacterium]|uniref:Sugar ABC transporter substrate-binding protein n=2 Tax=Microbacterium maritypicum TaxID=33918 RepID=A0ACD4B688_MICMQ|nr:MULTISPECIES: sugar ABC transporter substrate-binding protein [Microbacterium]EYT60491.1 sugar ABC transporter substrate-binding protein [Microbacterium sp. UCD-TDU]MBP5803662.1 sugar ABC transporter substrate-binding protein [Microbacterium liquefaciens]UTT52796.1 sugar ABC transporter substrate-binding protein [Microbacterium liquefaciens]WEF20888.1 sugar ABC transporter substrate-binding protein [Microbacterium liquefaciens]
MKSLTRRIIALGAAAAAAISLAGCAVTTGNPTGGGGGATEDKDEYRVAYIARAQADSFAAWLANEMKAEAGNYDDLTLEVFDGQADDEIENKMIENAIANKFDAIIIQANNADAQLPYIQQAIDAGIVTITTNPRVEGLTGGNSVDADPYKQGAVVAQLALEEIPENANVVVLNGPAGNFHSTARREAWEAEFFEKRPDVKIVAEDIANWNKDEAMTLMEDWSLANPDVDAIISMNDNMASGALEAVKGKGGFDGILAYGVDGTPEAVLLIEAGTMTATSLQNARELAQLNLKAVHDLLTGAEDEVNVDIGNPLITKDNVQEYIDLYKEAGLLDK